MIMDKVTAKTAKLLLKVDSLLLHFSKKMTTNKNIIKIKTRKVEFIVFHQLKAKVDKIRNKTTTKSKS